MKAKDLMTSNPEVVTPEDTVTRAAQMMRDTNVGIIPVVGDRKNMRLEGLITDRDITMRHVAEGHQGECMVRDHMTKERLDTVHPDADAHEVTNLMKRDQVRRVPVVEDGQRLVGIIAQADVAVKEGPEEPEDVEETLEKISEPGHPER